MYFKYIPKVASELQWLSLNFTRWIWIFLCPRCPSWPALDRPR